MALKVDISYILTFVVCVGVRQCCGYIYTGNSAYGIFVAIAVPLNLPHRNVFVSYNFEANYNLPGDAKTIIPGPYQRFTSVEETGPAEEVVVSTGETEVQEVEDMGRKESGSIDTISTNIDSKSKKPQNSKALITRRAVYRILQDKLKYAGFRGEDCLLKLICEINASLLGRHNGVLGNILHILLTPSTSSCENLPKKMYKAEENGVKGDCFEYENNCPHNISDLFSAPIENFLNT